MKVLTIFGTRPEAIKMAPVISALKNANAIETFVCVTGQHRDMLDQVLKFFNVIPDFDLNVMRSTQGLANLTSAIITKLDEIMLTLQPDLVLVHGDTTTTLASSLSAYYNKVPVGHVEAGLRTNDIYSPWPEEINRKLTASIATLHFAPTPLARQNLVNEGVNPKRIVVTGNTVIDALHFAVKLIKSQKTLSENLFKKFLLPTDKKIVLVTGHRRESFGRGFQNICDALKLIAMRNDVHLIYPVHLNPNVSGIVTKELGDCDNIQLLPPQDYVDFVYLMTQADIILTDSGGIQEEAPSLGKPVLVMRDFTERPEGLDLDNIWLVGTDVEKIVSTVQFIIDKKLFSNSVVDTLSPYGRGDAALKIVESLDNYRTGDFRDK